MTRFHVVGNFGPRDVTTVWRSASRAVVPEVERAIEMAWQVARSRPGVHLFDGPMCRLDQWGVTDGRLELQLSPTSYKAFLGTNLINARLAEHYGDKILASTLGVSSALVSSDGEMMFGLRSKRVAYYPGRVHPFAGSLEMKEPMDVFSETARELKEELNLLAADVREMRCLGLCEDVSIRAPELIFRVMTSRTRAEVERLLDEQEHDQTWCIPATPLGIERALREPMLTPVARGTAALWGRSEFGDEWFAPVRARLETR
jgi:hypothetical protein